MAEKEEGAQQDKKEGAAEAKDKSKTSNADSGKVVNLMAGEPTLLFSFVKSYDQLLRRRYKPVSDAPQANKFTLTWDGLRIGNIVAGAYYIYGSPLEIIIASIFLYK